MYALILVAIIAFLIGRFFDRYSIVIVPKGMPVPAPVPVPAQVTQPMPTVTSTPAVPAGTPPTAPVAPVDTDIHVSNMTDDQIYRRLFDCYATKSCVGPWTTTVPADLRAEFRRRGLNGRDHNMYCDNGLGIHLPDLSV